ncbi:DUF3108 domain-containing protein [Balneola sp. MJW-20]|uniref:DUF3108 domain-containing protein n=1 Tax=Gracilimonas aurantiaca TaxID=3234185 RepID=UPI0034664144
MIRISLIIMLLLSSVATAQNTRTPIENGPPGMDDLFSIKETFRFEVKYGLFKLGWVDVELESDSMFKGKSHHHLVTTITSNSKIPFVGKEKDVYHSLFYVNEEGLPVSTRFWKDNLDEDEFDEIVYEFDRDDGLVYYKEEDDSRDTLKLEEPATAGHIIFYFSRLFAGSEDPFTLPVYVTKKKGYILASNSLEKEKRNYKPFDGSVQTYMLSGSTDNITGPFGFSGDFRAWFLDDEYRVPLEARVKVLWGNVIVRLIEYNRESI